MNYIRGFAPWLCYAGLSPFDWRLGMCAAAITALLLAGQFRVGNSDLLGAATCAYFVVMAVVALAAPNSQLHDWTSALASGTLAATAVASLAVRKPFTLSMARTQVPEKFWNHPAFIRVNMVITSAWAAAFAVSAIACALIAAYDRGAGLPLITIQVLAFLIPLVFSNRYATRAVAAARRAHAQH